MWGYLRRLHTKFEGAEVKNARSRGHQNFGLTVLEAEISRSSNMVDIGVYGLDLTS